MINWQELTIDMFVQQLRTVYQRTYGDISGDYGRIVAWCGRLALENIANSDALYHNVEHTILVSLAGQAVIEGKHLREGGVTPRDWMHYMIAVRTVYDLIASGKLVAHRFGRGRGGIRIAEADRLEWETQCRRGQQPRSHRPPRRSGTHPDLVRKHFGDV